METAINRCFLKKARAFEAGVHLHPMHPPQIHYWQRLSLETETLTKFSQVKPRLDKLNLGIK